MFAESYLDAELLRPSLSKVGEFSFCKRSLESPGGYIFLNYYIRHRYGT
jgi:hypothetical protein